MLIGWVFAVGVALADWMLVERADRSGTPPIRARWFTKIAPMVVLVALAGTASTVAATAATDGADGVDAATQRWMIAALLACLAGDVLLLMAERWFIAGLGAFLLGHLFFVVAFVGHRSESSTWSALVLIAIPFGLRIVGGAAGRDRFLGGAVVAYLLVITAMFVAAAGTGEPWLVGGAALFVASDTVLGWNRFVAHRRGLPAAVMVTYHLAQFCFVAWLTSR